jgi:growth factor-regulated tyrosine kinase substrate
MLEERLSKAYSQHSIGGYNLPPPRQAAPAGPYPNLQPSAPSIAGPAESFYTNEPSQVDYTATPAQPYAQPVQQPYAGYDRRASVLPPNSQYPPVQVPQHTGAYAPPTPAPQYGQQPGYPSSEPPQSAPVPSQPSAPDAVGTAPTSDPAASYYLNPQQQPPSAPLPQQQPTSPPDPAVSPYPNLSQPLQGTYQPSLPQTPASVPAQPSQQQAQAQPTPQQASQPYWAHPAASQVPVPPVWQPQQQPQQQQQQNSNTYAGYTSPEAFPSAPQHAPATAVKQPVVEESLIEL